MGAHRGGVLVVKLFNGGSSWCCFGGQALQLGLIVVLFWWSNSSMGAHRGVVLVVKLFNGGSSWCCFGGQTLQWGLIVVLFWWSNSSMGAHRGGVLVVKLFNGAQCGVVLVVKLFNGGHRGGVLVVKLFNGGSSRCCIGGHTLQWGSSWWCQSLNASVEEGTRDLRIIQSLKAKRQSAVPEQCLHPPTAAV
ncbi:hypothetical protein ACOMHN_025243 [Nucella lapillus]